jgi:beta-galactosidase GanA
MLLFDHYIRGSDIDFLGGFHEPGVYYWDDWRDIGRFIKLIQKYGMYCILRPGPYAVSCEKTS